MNTDGRGSERKVSMATTGATMAAPLQSQRIRSAATGTEVVKMTTTVSGGLTRVRSGITRPKTSFMNTEQLATVESLRAPNSHRKAMSRRNSTVSGRCKNSGSRSLGNGMQTSSRKSKKRMSNSSARAANQHIQIVSQGYVAVNGK